MPTPATESTNKSIALQLLSHAALAAVALGALLAAACNGAQSPELDPDNPLEIGEEGDECGGVLGCESPLVCSRSFRCARPGTPGTVPAGGGCSQDGDCQALLACGVDGACVTLDGVGLDEFCAEAIPCRSDLICGASAACLAPGAPGTSAEGEACTTGEDCRLGLICNEALCARLQTWRPLCAPEASEEPVAYFRVPRSGQGEADFFYLPFPNDLRLKEGRLDLRHHPRPGSDFPVPGVAELVDELRGEQRSGFSPMSTVIFRFSQPVDAKSIRSVVSSGDDANMLLVEFNAQDLAASRRRGMMWTSRDQGLPYVCGPWMGFRPVEGWPIATGTAAVVLLDGLKTWDGDPIGREPDLDALLGDARPGSADLSRVHETYAPLRAWLDAVGIDRGRVLSAALFSVDDPPNALARLRAATDAWEPGPTIDEVVVCDEGVASPCASDGTADLPERGCGPQAAGYVELHGTVTLPIFQEGMAPYTTEGEGGVPLYAGGAPPVVRTESVCFSLTVPSAGPMPEAGWPLLLFAHGTGGSFRSHVHNGLAELVAGVDVGGEAPVRVAVLGIDAPLHGPRRNSDQPSEELFFDYRNPGAARGNSLQAIADLFGLARLAGAGLTLTAGDLEVRTDPAQVHFMGHSQGAQTGVPFLAFADEVQSAVLSGAGADLVTGLMTKSQPVDLTQAIKVLLGDPALSPQHPILGLMQQYFDVVDPVHYGPLVFGLRREGTTRQHTFHVVGTDDHYSPPETMVALARALRVHQAVPRLEPVEDLDPVTLPATGNYYELLTGVMEQFAPDGDYDGHFVAFRHTEARRKLAHFIATAVANEMPTVPR